MLSKRALTFAQPHGNAFWVGLTEHNYIAYSNATIKKNAKKKLTHFIHEYLTVCKLFVLNIFYEKKEVNRKFITEVGGGGEEK